MTMYARGVIRDFDPSHDIAAQSKGIFVPAWKYFCIHEWRTRMATAVEAFAQHGLLRAAKHNAAPSYTDDNEAPAARRKGRWVKRRKHSAILQEIDKANTQDKSMCYACKSRTRKIVIQEQRLAASRTALDEVQVEEQPGSGEQSDADSEGDTIAITLKRFTRRKRNKATKQALPVEDVELRWDRWDPLYDDYGTAQPVDDPQVIPSFQGMDHVSADQRQQLSAVDYGFRLAPDSMHIQTLTPNTSHRAHFMPRGGCEIDPLAWAREFNQNPTHPSRDFVDLPEDIGDDDLGNDIAPGEEPDNLSDLPVSSAALAPNPEVWYHFSDHRLRCSSTDLHETSKHITHVPAAVMDAISCLWCKNTSSLERLPTWTLHAVSEALRLRPDVMPSRIDRVKKFVSVFEAVL